MPIWRPGDGGWPPDSHVAWCGLAEKPWPKFIAIFTLATGPIQSHYGKQGNFASKPQRTLSNHLARGRTASTNV